MHLALLNQFVTLLICTYSLITLIPFNFFRMHLNQSIEHNALFLFFLQNLVEESLWPMLAKESLKALGGLGLLSLGGKYLLRRVFEVCLFINTSKRSALVFICWET